LPSSPVREVSRRVVPQLHGSISVASLLSSDDVASVSEAGKPWRVPGWQPIDLSETRSLVLRGLQERCQDPESSRHELQWRLVGRRSVAEHLQCEVGDSISAFGVHFSLVGRCSRAMTEALFNGIPSLRGLALKTLLVPTKTTWGRFLVSVSKTYPQVRPQLSLGRCRCCSGSMRSFCRIDSDPCKRL